MQVRGEYGPHNQGVLNLVDNHTDDGGTALVPRFHKVYPAWSEALGAWKDNRVGSCLRGHALACAPILACQTRRRGGASDLHESSAASLTASSPCYS